MTGTRSAGSDSLQFPSSAHALLEAVVAISSDLDLHSVLNRIVASACEITSARYGALGVIGSTGGLVDFTVSGLTEEDKAAIGQLPRGHGILGLLADEQRSLRLDQLQCHPRAVGFPDHHPQMNSFLGLPIRIRGTVFGNLYLTEKTDGGAFTETDERLVGALATAAGFVIENARAYAQSERRRQWLEASAQITEALQPPVRLHDALQQIAVSARRVAGAAAVAVVQNEEDHNEIAAWDGHPGEHLGELVADFRKHIDRAVSEPDVVIVPWGSENTVVLVPLRAHVAKNGVLLVLLHGGRGSLEVEDAELLASFADQASFALDRAQAISDRAELAIVSDRDRIARDLHDLVIQRLFATGLQLQGARRFALNDDAADRIDKAVADLDLTIRDIRSTIFELQNAHRFSIRIDISVMTKEYEPVLGFTPSVRTAGPVDTAVSRELGDQLLAVLREALSNVARHADASAVIVEVDVTETHVSLRVLDDGRGITGDEPESGLRNVRLRASKNGGRVQLYANQPCGTVLEWRVPLDQGKK